MNGVASSATSAEHSRPTDPAPTAPGLRMALRILLEHFGNHVTLLKLETSHELTRLGTVLGLWVGIILTLQLALMLVSLVTIAWLWDTPYRIAAIAVSFSLLLLLTGWMWWRLKRLAQAVPLRFASSSAQWQQDLDIIKSLL